VISPFGIRGLGSGFGGGGHAFSTNYPLTVTRASVAWAQDRAGDLFAFGVDEQRLTNAGLTLTRAATRMHGEAPINGTNGGATSSVLPVEGLFNPVRSISAGASFQRRVSLPFETVNAEPIFLRMRARQGSSPRIRLAVRDRINATESVVLGTFDAPAIGVVTAGPLTSLVNRLLPNGDREFTFTWTPNATSTAAEIAVGPDSGTSGEFIDIIGMQATTQFSEWIMGGAGILAQSGDNASLSLTGVNMAAGFMLRIDGTLMNVPVAGFSRFYQADTGNNDNRNTTFYNFTNGRAEISGFVANVFQGGGTLKNPVVAAPFSIVAAHAVNYIGGAYDKDVASPTTSAGFTTPNRLSIGSNGGFDPLNLVLTRISLFPETPTTARVTEVAA